MRRTLLTVYLEAAFGTDESSADYHATRAMFVNYMNNLPPGASDNRIMALGTNSMRANYPELNAGIAEEEVAKCKDNPLYQRWLKRVMIRSM